MSTDLAVAQGIAEAVRQAQAESKRRSWRKVTTLLSAFGLYNLTDSARSRIGDALHAAGLVVDPAMAEVERSGAVRLSLQGASQQAPETSPGSLLPGVTMWRWDAGSLIRDNSGKPPSPAQPVLVDVDVSQAASATLRDGLLRVLVGLNEETLDDLLEADVQAAFKRSKIKNERRASVFVALSSRAEDKHNQAVAVDLALIELAVAPPWLLVVRHAAQTYENGAPTGDADVLSSDQYVAQLESVGLDTAVTSMDAAMVVIEHAVASFGTLQAEFSSYLDSWRLEFTKRPKPDRQLLVNLQASLPVVTDSLRPLKHPSALSWAGPSSEARARQVRDEVERSIEASQGLAGATASALVLVDQLRAENYQRSLATLAAVLLAPGLVAAVFSASSKLNSSWTDLLILLMLMALTALGSYFTIKRFFNADR